MISAVPKPFELRLVTPSWGRRPLFGQVSSARQHEINRLLSRVGLPLPAGSNAGDVYEHYDKALDADGHRYENMEFSGDKTLGFIVSEFLRKRLGDKTNPAQLSFFYQVLTSNNVLAEIGKAWQLPLGEKYLDPRGEMVKPKKKAAMAQNSRIKQHSNKQTKTIADVVEALVQAQYEIDNPNPDSPVRNFGNVWKLLTPYLEQIAEQGREKGWKLIGKNPAMHLELKLPEN